jgi:hypothetical protein
LVVLNREQLTLARPKACCLRASSQSLHRDVLQSAPNIRNEAVNVAQSRAHTLELRDWRRCVLADTIARGYLDAKFKTERVQAWIVCTNTPAGQTRSFVSPEIHYRERNTAPPIPDKSMVS